MNLREELGGLAGQSVSYADPDKAVKKAKARRTRRLIAAPLAVAAVLAVSIPLALQSFGGGKEIPSGNGDPAPAYVTPDGTLTTPTGMTITLPDWKGGEVVGVPDGWLVIPEDGDAYLQPRSDGARVDLEGITQASMAHVSPDGTKLAWKTFKPNVLHVAELGTDGLTGEVSSPVAVDTVSIAGWSGSLLLLDYQSADMTQEVGWDSWDPAEGDFAPDWQDGNIEHMTTSVERALVNVERDVDSCLIYVDTRTKQGAGENCRPFNGSVLGVSPDGDWLFVTMESAEEGDMVGAFIDTGNYFSGAPPEPIRGCGKGQGMQADWHVSGTLFVLSGGRAVECSPLDGEGSGKDVPEGTVLVPRYGI